MSLVATRKFAKGESILKHGDMSNYVLFVESGQVDCIGRDADGMPFHVCTIEPGNSFGKPQLHCQSRVDLVALEDDVTVQYMEKDAFMRVTGKEGLEVWESTQQAEHTVYFTALGHTVEGPVPPPGQGACTMKMFAALPSKDKVKVLEFADCPGVERFRGVPREGKIDAFSKLAEDAQREALSRWLALNYTDAGSMSKTA